MLSLGKVATIERRGVDPAQVDPATRYIGLEHIARGGRITATETVSSAEIKSTKFQFTPSHLLFGKLRPNLGKIARPVAAGVCSTDILPVLPGPELSRDYLFHYLSQPRMIDFAASQASGANLPRLSPKALEDFIIPLPPLDEQRRIAAILDQADGIREKRSETRARLEDLAESLFLDLFDEDSADAVSFDSVVTSFRNGLSPAKAGTVLSDVLTLSSVTQGIFDPTAVKTSTFMAKPPAAMRVSGDDFLICRGNGNLNLVGVGVSPGHDYPDLTFPDTVIAASLDAAKVDPVYLEMAWKRPAVRRQVESVARTTNGTYKINQQSLGAVRIVIPPLSEQQEFARRIRTIPNPGLSELNELFSSLQSRAFAGQL